MSGQLIAALTLAILDMISVKHMTESQPTVKHTAKWHVASRWAKLILKISDDEKEDPFLVAAIIYRESTFDPNKVNEKTGAVGLMQIMPASADHVLLGWKKAQTNSIPIEKLMDPATNLRVGIRILKRYKQLCEGDLVKALNAYNGQQCVEGAAGDFGHEVERRWLRARSFYKPTT